MQHPTVLLQQVKQRTQRHRKMKIHQLPSGSYFQFSCVIEALGHHAIRSTLLYMGHDRRVYIGCRPAVIEDEFQARNVTPCTNYGTPLHLVQK